MFYHSEASGGRFRLDVGLISGSMLGSRVHYAILAKNSTAPRREHDFQGPGAPDASETSFQQPGSESVLGALGLDFGAFWDPF